MYLIVLIFLVVVIGAVWLKSYMSSSSVPPYLKPDVSIDDSLELDSCC